MPTKTPTSRAPETVVALNLLAGEEELEAVRQRLGPSVNQLSMPSFRRTPISEFNRTQPLLAFPTLFPLMLNSLATTALGFVRRLCEASPEIPRRSFCTPSAVSIRRV